MLDVHQAALIKGMLARGDHQHHIAAHFGENSARISEIKKGEKFADVKPATGPILPPPKIPRFIDPKATAETQYTQLQEFIRQPPETSRIIIFTPALSKLVIDRINENNRRQRPSNIKRFAAAMVASNWVLTGDTIKFSKSGQLIDGQNRLKACVRSEKSFRTHVVFGVADDAFSRIDSGASRTNPDTLQIAGVPYYTIVAPAVRWIMISNDTGPGKRPDRGRKIDNDEILTFYNKHIDADLMQTCSRAASEIGSRHLASGSLAALLYLFEQKNERVAAKFINDLKNRRAGGRKLIVKITNLRKQNMGRVNELQQTALIIQAWNAYRANTTVTAKTLSWNENKEYPDIA